MNSNRLGPRRLDEPDRQGRRRATQPPARKQDKTALYVGLGVGGGVLVLALAFAMSSGSGQDNVRVDRSADKALKADLEAAQRLADKGKTAEALHLLEGAIQNSSYRSSPLMPQVKTQADRYRQQIAFENEAASAILDFDKRITASKADKTAMTKADAFWNECNDLLTKYSRTAQASILRGWRDDLERWRGTNAQDVWQKDYNYTKDRIKSQHLDGGNFSMAVKDWKRFAEPFSAPELKARVETELRAIDHMAKEAATKLVQSSGSGPMAKQKLEAEMERFVGTEGHQVILQKLKTIQ